VAATSSSALSARLTSSSGCSTQLDDQESTTTGAGDSSIGGPGTRPDALATAAAPSPARRASASVSVGVAWNPHDEPIRARTPTPATSDCVRSSTTRLRAAMASWRLTMTRASA
jgi:hypothetical protein